MSDPMIDAADRYVDEMQACEQYAHLVAVERRRRRLMEIKDAHDKLRVERDAIYSEIAASIGATVGEQIDYGYGVGKVTGIRYAGVGRISRLGDEYIAFAQLEVAPQNTDGSFHKTLRKIVRYCDDTGNRYNPVQLTDTMCSASPDMEAIDT